MEITTSRFSTLEIAADTVVRFPLGLMGLEQCREWVLLRTGDGEEPMWLQSVERSELALAVVRPRRFVPDYRVRLPRSELVLVGLSDVRDARVLAIVGKTDGGLVLNLKAPLILNVRRGLGRQVIANGDLPIHHIITNNPATWRRIA